jgi:hypothetical protein
MSVVVCTLFEGHYHYGLAALINSLYLKGYSGTVYAGYRGELPDWSIAAKKQAALSWEGASDLQVCEELCVRFLPIESEFHLTNYKPFFMLRLFEVFAADITSIIYFDPDIIIKCNWKFFCDWISYGVALVHEVNSNDMPPTHPLRKQWEQVINKSGKKITRNLYSYINGGFCGVTKYHIEFLKSWVDITNTAIQYFGLTPDQWTHNYDRTYMFYAQDQDTLNITAMCSEVPISEMGPEAMDFIHGGFTMSHAVGSPKPWRKVFLLASSRGNTPSAADKAYWENVQTPIRVYSKNRIKLTNAVIKIASFIGRFYKRS